MLRTNITHFHIFYIIFTGEKKIDETLKKLASKLTTTNIIFYIIQKTRR